MELASKTKRCDVCQKEEAKYRCPKCLIRSCSLPCVKKHKGSDICSGVRDKTKFTKMSEFNDLNLLSDYRFLEDVGRKADSAYRELWKYNSKNMPYSLKRLVKTASQTGIKLKFLPKTFSKRQKNQMRYSKEAGQISWTVEWMFPQEEAKHFAQHLQGEVISDALVQVYDPEKTNSVVRHTLRHYINKGLDGVQLFLRKECCPANDIRFYPLKPTDSLGKCLSGKTVIEFPSIHVVFTEKASEYPLVEEESSTEAESSSDEEDVGEEENGDKEKQAGDTINRNKDLQAVDTTLNKEMQPGDTSLIKEMQPGDTSLIKETQLRDTSLIKETQPGDTSLIKETQPGDTSLIKETQPGDTSQTVNSNTACTAPVICTNDSLLSGKETVKTGDDHKVVVSGCTESIEHQQSSKVDNVATKRHIISGEEAGEQGLAKRKKASDFM